MKPLYRKADAVIQLLLLAAWLWAFIIKSNWVFQFYFIAGGWYLVSLIVHLIITSLNYKSIYRAYAFLIGFLIVLLCLGFILQLLLVLELYFLLFASPVIALLYTYNCISEINYLRKRPISYLK